MLVTALAEHLNVDTSELPIAVTAPEWMEQKATIDGFFISNINLVCRFNKRYS
jgi:carbon-monoxide dehydrogenase catalytic subunit